MIQGYTGIIVSYVILISCFLYIMIRLKGKWIIKSICILAFLYYSIAMAYAINSFMGWPTSLSIPDNSRIVWIQIQEPDWIYFWVQTDFKDRDILRIDPRKAFQYISKKEPRIFKIEYTKEEHKKILEALKKKKGMPGSQILIKKGKKKKTKRGKKGQGIDNTRNLQYRILNPFELMPKG